MVVGAFKKQRKIGSGHHQDRLALPTRVSGVAADALGKVVARVALGAFAAPFPYPSSSQASG